VGGLEPTLTRGVPTEQIRNMITRRVKLIRHRTLPSAGSRTLFFTTDFIGRKGHPDVFRPHQVPEFEGDSAWFEAVRRPKLGWQIIRRVTEHGQPWLGPETPRDRGPPL
jgi:hypothetical protein